MSLPDKFASMNMDEILDFCIQQEQQAIDLYARLRDMAADDASKAKFQELVDMETEHKIRLQDFELEEYLDLPPVNLKVTDYLLDPGKEDTLTTQEILILAAKREDKAAQMYQALADHFTQNPELTTFFQMMADEELRHKFDLETEYEDEFLQEG